MRACPLRIIVFVIAVLLLPMTAVARTLVVNQNHPQARDDAPGTETAPLRTINAAAQLAQPGDTVLVHAGIYRERVAPARGGAAGQPITYQAAPGETVCVRGSEPCRGSYQAHADHPGVFTVKVDASIFEKRPDGSAYNAFAIPQRGGVPTRTLGQVFLDGQPLTEVDSPDEVDATPMSWRALDNGQQLRINFGPRIADPSTHLVEFSARRRIFAPYLRGLGYITIRGFVFEHACNEANADFYSPGMPPQAGMIGTRAGHHWVIENNTVRFAKSIGIDAGRELTARASAPCAHCGSWDGPPDVTSQETPTYVGYHTIRNNIITDNGEIGVTGLGQIQTVISNNFIARNNALVYRDLESGGIKCHYFIRGRIEQNLIADNQSWGLWLDNVWQDTRVTRNVFINNAAAGIFMELGTGYSAMVDNNVILNTRVHPGGTGRRDYGSGAGFYTHDASGILLTHNLIAGSEGYGVFLKVSGPRNYQELPRDITSFPAGRPAATTRAGARAPRAASTGPAGFSGSRGRSAASDLRVLDNIIVSNAAGAINMPYPGQFAQRDQSDGNLIGPNQAFFVNHTGGTSMDDILAAIDKALPGNSIGQNVRAALTTTRNAAAPTTATTRRLSFQSPPVELTFDQWKTIMGFGAHSVILDVASVQMDRASERVVIRTNLSDVPVQRPVADERLKVDLLGNVIRPDAAVPGPFQQLKTGQQEFVVWPPAK